MARPIKQGLEYFTVDTGWDRKMKLVRAKYKAEGIGIIILLWQWIYNEGYFTKWDGETKLIFASDNHIDESMLDEIVLFAIEKEIFSKELYEKYRVLTSKGIQKRYLSSCLKRTEIRFYKNLLLIDPILPDWSKAKLIISKNEIFPVSETSTREPKTANKESKTPIKDSKSTQSKVKESKVKESKFKKKKKDKESETSIKEKNIIQQQAQEILEYYKKLTGKMRLNDIPKEVTARLNKGCTVEEGKKVILFKFLRWWSDPDKKEWVNLTTLFRPSHFEEYLSQAEQGLEQMLLKAYKDFQKKFFDANIDKPLEERKKLKVPTFEEFKKDYSFTESRMNSPPG